MISSYSERLPGHERTRRNGWLGVEIEEAKEGMAETRGKHSSGPVAP
ncbi:MAG TPA: hypothetical protein VLA60_04295 [Nitrospirales bacterium]|nr:hypothetical protein [Nitrospirales bacterium]